MRITIKLLLSVIAMTFIFMNPSFSQKKEEPFYRKGNFSLYWGWNRAYYSTSDIRFSGTDYDFILKDVIAKDRQSTFDSRIYLNPKNITIPQYNVRLAYFIKDKYQVSIGTDHMKYVMQNNQTVKIDGHIENSGTKYDGNYDNRDIDLTKDFLLFEHTDGLNYANIELRIFDTFFERKNFILSLNGGLGSGILIPRTNTTLLNKDRYDQFHLSGYGINAIAALNLTFFDYFFIQTECKGGFIHMPDIRTTVSKEDRAQQSFFFSQFNVVFGANFRFPQKNNSPK